MSKEGSLKGKFVKVANSDGSQDFDESFWIVSIGEMILFKTTVKSYCKFDPSLNYNTIATIEFGHLLLKRARRMKAYW